jgi:hypothetical protein
MEPFNDGNRGLTVLNQATHMMQTFRTLEEWLHAFVTNALNEISGQLLGPSTLPLGKNLVVATGQKSL